MGVDDWLDSVIHPLSWLLISLSLQQILRLPHPTADLEFLLGTNKIRDPSILPTLCERRISY